MPAMSEKGTQHLSNNRAREPNAWYYSYINYHHGENANDKLHLKKKMEHPKHRMLHL